MDDSDLMTAIREPFARVLMTTPVDSVVTRGRGVRRHRRLRGLAAAAAVVTTGVVSVLLAVVPECLPPSTPSAVSISRS